MLSYPRAESSQPGGSEKLALSWVDVVGCGESFEPSDEAEEALEEDEGEGRCSSFRLVEQCIHRWFEGREVCENAGL